MKLVQKISERRKPISVVRVVIVSVPVVVDIAKIVRVVIIRRSLPPIVGRAGFSNEDSPIVAMIA